MREQILKEFSKLEESELEFLYSMSVAASRVMDAADALPNVMKASISNSCGVATANDGTDYQVKIILVANKEEWRDKEVVEVLSSGDYGPMNSLNINDIN